LRVRRTIHAGCHRHHRRIDRLRRAGRPRVGSGGSHRLCQHARETGRNAPQVAEAQKYAAEHAVDLRTIELDVASEASADAAIEEIVTATVGSTW
jgi:hypothetical protein